VAYENSYKDYVQRVISKVIDPSAQPPRILYIAKPPPTTGRLQYANQYIDQYVQVIDELVAENPEIFVAPPDFQCYFSAHPERISDGIHPDGLGYVAIADLWFKMILDPNADTCTLP
jgi:lysophospholipase L1-like esterase